MKETNREILDWFKLLRTRPKMMISANTIDYLVLQTHIEGYIAGVSLMLNKEMAKLITRWYEKKLGVQSNFYWTSFIFYHYKGKNDEELKEILLDVTEEYFRENPDWCSGCL